MEWTPDAIRNFKDRHGLTGDSMAEILGCNRSYVFLLMKGQKTPSGMLCRLLDCLDGKMPTETGKERADGKAQENFPKR